MPNSEIPVVKAGRRSWGAICFAVIAVLANIAVGLGIGFLARSAGHESDSPIAPTEGLYGGCLGTAAVFQLLGAVALVLDLVFRRRTTRVATLVVLSLSVIAATYAIVLTDEIVQEYMRHRGHGFHAASTRLFLQFVPGTSIVASVLAMIATLLLGRSHPVARAASPDDLGGPR